MNPFLDVQNLTKRFGARLLFDSISFSIGEGDKVGLIAQNGTGKSTLLSILAGDEPQDSGSIIYRNGIKVGYLRQKNHFPPEATVLEACLSSPQASSLSSSQRPAPGGSVGSLRPAPGGSVGSLRPAPGGSVAGSERPAPGGSVAGHEEPLLKAKQVLTSLNIKDLNQKIGNLSGGQQKRVALAQILIAEPDLFILDEPTNHLDLHMIEWLEGFLRRGNKTILMVTHDRYFLDNVCNQILELDDQTIYPYRGNFSYYLEKRQERIDVRNATIERANNLYRRELEWMRRQPQARGHKARYREDAFYELEKIAKQRIEQRQLRLKNTNTYIGSKIFECQYVSKAYPSGETAGHSNLQLPVPGGSAAGYKPEPPVLGLTMAEPPVLGLTMAEPPVLGHTMAEPTVILKDFYYNFSRYEKLGIVGDNGAGKSTFIKLLLGLEQPDSGRFDIGQTVRFGYFSQDGLQFRNDQRVIDVVRDIAEYINLGGGKHLTAGQLLERFLFSRQQQYDYVYKLSGGEQRKLYLCTVLMQDPNFLILDEPTNDLDIQTLEVLEEYLQDFPGCVIVVSHDRFFTDKIVDHLLVFHGQGRIQDFPGNYTQYREYSKLQPKAESEARNKTKPSANERPVPGGSAAGSSSAASGSSSGSSSAAAGSAPAPSKPRKLSYKETRELAQLETDIAALEKEKAALVSALSSGDIPVEKIVEYGKRLPEVEALLDEKEMRWLELQE